MSRREQYEKRAEELLMPVITEKNLELVDIEYVKEGSSWYLRAYIDKEGGVDINDCEAVSRAFSDILDKEDPIEDEYILEVSSPGLGRPLKKDKDFTRNIDKKIEFKSYKAIDGQKEFEGILRSFDAETFTIDDENNNTSTFKRKEMALIREYVEW